MYVDGMRAVSKKKIKFWTCMEKVWGGRLKEDADGEGKRLVLGGKCSWIKKRGAGEKKGIIFWKVRGCSDTILGREENHWEARRTTSPERDFFPEQLHQVKEEEKVQLGEEEEEFSRGTHMIASWRRAHHNRTMHWDFMPLQRYPHSCKLKRNSP